MLYKQAFESLTTEREVFVSDVIGRCIHDMQIFTEKHVTNYVDVGTAQDWFEHNDRPVIFVTAREPQYRAETRQMLYELGFMSFTLIEGLQNSRRILINDYNNANPYPRATAINIKRDSDNLGDFL